MADPYVGIITTLGAALIAGAIGGGTALAITHIALGDGAGLTTNPAASDTHLVHEVWRGAITAAGRDLNDPTMWRFTTEVPEEAGPFVIREIGLFNAANVMVAVARHPLTTKALTIDGIATSLITEMAIPVSTSADVTVNFFNDEAGVGLWRLLRPPFVAVNSATVTAPPGAPAIGDTYVIPAGATGGWAGQANKLVQWSGSLWSVFSVPLGTLVAAMDTGAYLKRTADGWTSFLASIAETRDGAEPTKAITPQGQTEVIMDILDHCFAGDPDFGFSVLDRLRAIEQRLDDGDL